MSWTPLLLSDPSPNLRYLVLKHLLDETDEAKELENIRHQDPIIKQLLTSQNPDGSWSPDSITGNARQGSRIPLQPTREGWLMAPRQL
jgi:hypothetical protein